MYKVSTVIAYSVYEIPYFMKLLTVLCFFSVVIWYWGSDLTNQVYLVNFAINLELSGFNGSFFRDYANGLVLVTTNF